MAHSYVMMPISIWAKVSSPKFYKISADKALGQSISRRFKCWDNAPQETFFGHFKDETNYKVCLDLKA